MSYIRVGAPRNTSNGDYGRFHFIPNMSSGQQMQQQQNASYSTDGNRMMQHVHYPNCPNRTSPQNKFSDGMKDYTIEYGEDAVRAALGGQMPDFQAQFQKQYGTNGADGAEGASYNLDPQAVQMVNNGKSKVAMIPVVLTSEGDDESNKTVNADDANNNENSNVAEESENVSNQTSTGCAPMASKTASTSKTQIQQEAPVATMAPKQENIANAFESARKARSTGLVKYGRHVRPSYWKPETPNPCRKKMTVCGGGDMPEAVNDNQQGETNAGMLNSQFIGNSNEMMMNGNGYCVPPGTQPMMPANGYFAPQTAPNMMNGNEYFAPPAAPPVMSANVQQQNPQRTRSLPPRQGARPTFSLCGKCKKCKNLRSETAEASVLTFPKYSTGMPGGFQRSSPQMLTSSNLGQSAKNFRAIRFSSNHM